MKEVTMIYAVPEYIECPYCGAEQDGWCGDCWVTDASVSEVYGCEAHVEIHSDYVPKQWAYID